MSTRLLEIAKQAETDKTYRYQDLSRELSEEFLNDCWRTLRRDAACGGHWQREAIEELFREDVLDRLAMVEAAEFSWVVDLGRLPANAETLSHPHAEDHRARLGGRWSIIGGRLSAEASLGTSPVREIRSPGSVRGPVREGRILSRWLEKLEAVVEMTKTLYDKSMKDLGSRANAYSS